MSPTFFESYNGSNCLVGDQPIISLNATEDMDADYATASAITIGEWYPRGQLVRTIEGGADTGLWEVEDSTMVCSGARTWRRRSGAGYAHVPLAGYRLRRKGWMAARATISKEILGGAFPPKFCTPEHYQQLTDELQARYKAGEITFWDMLKEFGTWTQVSTGQEIINQICAWVSLPVTYQSSLPQCADTYMPVSKSIMSAVREVASWSGASCYLDRTGTLVVYDWAQAYGNQNAVPQPVSVLEGEDRQALNPVNTYTVVGYGYRGKVINSPAEAGHWQPSYSGPSVWVPDQPARTWISGRWLAPVEVTERLYREAGEWPVEERIEITEYPINPRLAQLVARERLGRALLGSLTMTTRGPATGSTNIEPVKTRAFRVSRNLNWNGNAYRHEIEITGPRTYLDWGTSVSDSGWW